MQVSMQGKWDFVFTIELECEPSEEFLTGLLNCDGSKHVCSIYKKHHK